MTDRLLLETAEKVFADTSTYEAVQDAQRTGWAPAVWDAAAAVGLPWISVPEGAGGVGGTLADAVAVLQIAGRYAAPIPLAETGVLAGWLLAAMRSPTGRRTAVGGPGPARRRPAPRWQSSVGFCPPGAVGPIGDPGRHRHRRTGRGPGTGPGQPHRRAHQCGGRTARHDVLRRSQRRGRRRRSRGCQYGRAAAAWRARPGPPSCPAPCRLWRR